MRAGSIRFLCVAGFRCVAGLHRVLHASVEQRGMPPKDETGRRWCPRAQAPFAVSSTYPGRNRVDADARCSLQRCPASVGRRTGAPPSPCSHDRRRPTPPRKSAKGRCRTGVSMRSKANGHQGRGTGIATRFAFVAEAQFHAKSLRSACLDAGFVNVRADAPDQPQDGKDEQAAEPDRGKPHDFGRFHAHSPTHRQFTASTPKRARTAP